MVILKHIIMNEEFADIQYAPIKEYKYAPWFSDCLLYTSDAADE